MSMLRPRDVVQGVGMVLSIIGLVLAIYGVIRGSSLSEVRRKTIWVIWIIVPPIYFFVEYLVYYHGWIKITPEELDHVKHLQAIMAGIWVAVATILTARFFGFK